MRIEIKNKTRASFRRAGLRIPAKAQGPLILDEADLSDEQKRVLLAEPRLTIGPADDDDAPKPKSTSKAKPKSTKKPTEAAIKKAEAAHDKAMTAARKIEDSAKRQAAQDAANAALEKAVPAAT